MGTLLDYALVNLGVTVLLLVVTFLFRKRLLTALGRLLLAGSVKFARDTFLVESVEEAPDGTKRARIGLSDAGKGLVAAVTPVLIAEAVKSFKLKPGGAIPQLPEGLDLSNLSQSLPALLGSGMIPKRYAGILALAVPFLQGFMGGKKVGSKEGEYQMSKQTRDLIP